MARTPENAVKQAIKRVLDRRGIWYYMPVAGPFAVHGIPDFVCCWDGSFLAIEAKAPGNLLGLTANQKRKIEEIRGAGGYAVVVDDAEVLDKLLYEWEVANGSVRRSTERQNGADGQPDGMHPEAFGRYPA